MSRPTEDVPAEVEEDIEEEEYEVDMSRLFEYEVGDTRILVEDHRDGEMEFIERMQFPATLVALSKRNTGKSYLFKAYIKRLCEDGRITYIIVFSKTAHLNNTFDFLDDRAVIKGYSEVVMKAMFTLMTEHIQRIKTSALDNPAFSKEAPHLLIILDDVVGGTLPIGDEKVRQSTGRCSTLSEIFSMGRHFKTTIFIASQIGTVVLNPTIRNNIDQLIIGQNNEDAVEPLYKSTWGFDRLKTFRQFVNEYVQDHAFIMFDNLDALNTEIRWLVIRAPDGLEDFRVEFTTEERKKRKREEEEEIQNHERAKRRLQLQKDDLERSRTTDMFDTNDALINEFRAYINS